MRQIAVLLFILIAACSETKLKGAGVVAFSKANTGEIYFLLADHNFPQAHRGYGAFGGGIDENETIQTAALREFHEETQCQFASDSLVLYKEAFYNEDRSFVSLVVSVPHRTLSPSFQPDECQGGVYNERSDWRWVSEKDLQDYLDKPQTAPFQIWKKSAVILQQVLDKAPWEESI